MVTSTKEVFRIEHEFGGYSRLMKQSYSDKQDFYWIHDSTKNYESSVDSSSSDLADIVNYYKRLVKQYNTDKKNPWNKDNVKVLAVYDTCIKEAKMIIKNIQQYELTASK